MAMINVGDAEIHVESHGDGFPLFFVAGLGGRGAFWQQQVETFAAHFKVVLHDHRGTGHSTPGKCVSGVAQMADDLVAVMGAMGIEKAHLVGHSTGGAIGQHIALSKPQLLEKLVLSCSWAGPDAYFTQLFHTRRQVLVDSGPEAYISFGNYLGTPSSFLQPQMTSEHSFMNARVKAFPGVEVELSRIAAVLAHDLRSELHRIEKPTLCIGAKDDQITPPGFTEELAGLIDGAQLTLLEHGGHFCPISRAEEYNPVVLDFLQGGS